MLKVLQLRRSGFNKAVSVGESFLNESDKYIIIAISELHVRIYGHPQLEMTAVCQKVNSDNDFRKYEQYFRLKKRYNTAKDTYLNIYKVGQFLGNVGERKDLALQITGINKMYYEHVDLVVEYNAQLIKPWSKAEIDKALKEERLATFKVIGGKATC